MKVLFDHQVFSYQASGGVSRYFSELIFGLNQFNWEPNLGFKYTNNKYLMEKNPQKFRNLLPWFSFKGKQHLVNRLNKSYSKKQLNASNFDLFHPTYYDPYFLDNLEQKPFVLTIHDMIHELFPDAVSDAQKVCERKKKLAFAAKKIIAVSNHTKRDIVELLQIDPEKIEVVYHGNSLDPKRITPDSSNLPDDFFLYIGNRTTYKNFTVVLESFSRFADKHKSFFLVLAGGGPLLASEIQLMEKLKIQDKIIQKNPTDSGLAGLYSKATALIYSSLYEGFGLPLIEAMAFNCPVIAANSSCLPEIGGNAAQYFEPTNPEKLFASMTELSGDAEKIKELRLLGLERAKDFSWENSIKNTAAVYGTCL